MFRFVNVPFRIKTDCLNIFVIDKFKNSWPRHNKFNLSRFIYS